MNVVITMAGRGSRLSSCGVPKPLVEVAGKPLLAWSTMWLGELSAAVVTVVALEQHEREFGLSEVVARHIPGARCTFIPEVTPGQLCTVLCATEYLEPERPLLIAPCDTIMSGPLPLPSSLAEADRAQTAGIISVASMKGERWSFADCDSEWNVHRVAEKVRISDWASTGLYYFADTIRFLSDARALVESNGRVSGEFYVMPLYGRMLARGDRIKAVRADEMQDLGTPESLAEFECKMTQRRCA